MAATNFAKALDHILEVEGGYVDHPRDPGGATNMGITIGTLADWRGEPVTKQDVRDLTRKEAGEIYRARYWNAAQCDRLPSGVDLVAFDAAVNSGTRRGVRWVQSAVEVAEDGAVGPVTLKAVRAVDPATVITRACDERLAWLMRLGTWKTFGRGWRKRVESVRKMALELSCKGKA